MPKASLQECFARKCFCKFTIGDLNTSFVVSYINVLADSEIVNIDDVTHEDRRWAGAEAFNLHNGASDTGSRLFTELPPPARSLCLPLPDKARRTPVMTPCETWSLSDTVQRILTPRVGNFSVAESLGLEELPLIPCPKTVCKMAAHCPCLHIISPPPPPRSSNLVCSRSD